MLNHADAQWRAFCQLMDLREIESPGFAGRVRLLRELDLLEAILADDAAKVRRRLCQLKSALCHQIDPGWRCAPLCGCDDELVVARQEECLSKLRSEHTEDSA
jgi:hypothetical protein